MTNSKCRDIPIPIESKEIKTSSHPPLFAEPFRLTSRGILAKAAEYRLLLISVTSYNANHTNHAHIFQASQNFMVDSTRKEMCVQKGPQ
jgi:hypothetical protein